MVHVKDHGHAAVIQETLDSYPLQFAPGKNYAYSNFGYYLLGRVIEKLSGIPYGEYVRQHVQTPLGITDMRLATETPAAGFLMHRHDGMAWAVLVNTRREHSRMEKDLHQLSWDIARALQT